MESGHYASAAEKNRIRNVPILAPRGKILDREGRIIVDNYPSSTALLLRDSARDLNADVDPQLRKACTWMRTKCVRRSRRRSNAAVPADLIEEDITPDDLKNC